MSAFDAKPTSHCSNKFRINKFVGLIQSIDAACSRCSSGHDLIKLLSGPRDAFSISSHVLSEAMIERPNMTTEPTYRNAPKSLVVANIPPSPEKRSFGERRLSGGIPLLAISI